MADAKTGQIALNGDSTPQKPAPNGASLPPDPGSFIDLDACQKFISYLNTPIKQEEIKKLSHGAGRGAEYLPIDFVETYLDRTFFGLWSIENFKWQLVANELIGSIELLVFHPPTGKWIRRVGAASVAIQQDKDSPIDQIMHTKKKDALERGFPNLKASCVKNAAKSLGNLFGRSLNRDFTGTYRPFKPTQSVN